VPIPRHEHARDAARVACCGEEQGRGEAVLGALMTADDLRPDACRREAASAGADLEMLDACLASDRPERVLDADHEAALAAGVRTLPTCLIGDHRFEGLQSEADLRAAVSALL
jgi:2-hydroxychromene-2-carboxylate isomerase